MVAKNFDGYNIVMIAAVDFCKNYFHRKNYCITKDFPLKFPGFFTNTFQ